jgi:NAD(P)-dependent dehydrogenase (short-subunit alcohol dehydrogenase family)
MSISISRSQNRDVNSKPRVAVVAVANRGIWVEVHRRLARRGIYVILTGRDEAKGKVACERAMERACGGHAGAIGC